MCHGDTVYVVVVRDMAHLSCAPSVILFEDYGMATHYIYDILPVLITAEVGFEVHLRASSDAPYSKYKVVAADPAHDAQITVTVTVTPQHLYSKETT